MITKVRYSKNISSSINYIMNPGKDAHIVLHKGIYSDNNVNQIIRDFELQAQMRPALKVKAVHIPLSFHVKDKAVVDKYGNQIIQDWISNMESHGYRFDQYIVAQHHDKEHQHFHWLGNLIMNDGSRANIANIGLASKLTSMTITEKWGLTPANHRKVHASVRNKDSPKSISYSYGRKEYIHDYTQQTNSHATSSTLLDLLLPVTYTSYACSVTTSSRKKENKDKKKKRKKK